MKDTDCVAVLVPCYNEEATVEKVVRDFRAALPHAQVFVYDNNSTDSTAAAAAGAGATVRKEPQQGKGNVVRAMFRDIAADCYIIVDGDDTYPAKHAPEMVDLVLREGADLVIGDRLSSTYFTENKRPFHNTGNKLVKNLINLLFKSDVQDIMTGYRCMSYRFVKNLPIIAGGFEIETEMTIHALDQNFSIRQLPIEYQDRPEGSVSKLHTVQDGCKVLKTIFMMFRDYRPFLFFSLWALLFLVVSGALFLPVFIEYLNTGLVPRLPTLLVSGIALVISVQCFFSGMILDVIGKKHKQDFQMQIAQTKRPSAE